MATTTTTPFPDNETKEHESAATSRKLKEEDEHVIPANKMALVLPGLMLAVFLASLDQTIVATALPTIVTKLGGGNNYSWVGSAYLITAAAVSPACGKLSDIFGRKAVFYPSILIFLTGSALCGAAQSMTWLILSRALQGIGAGGIQQMVTIVISDIVTLEQRGAYTSSLGAIWGIAGVTGPVIGGALADHASWRWCFWINLPTGGIAIALLFYFLNLNPHHGMTLQELVREFDFLGLFLIVGGVLCLLIGFNQSQNGWDRAATISLVIVGAVIILLGLAWEFFTKRSPIMPSRLFKTRTTGSIFLTTFLHAFAFISAAFYLPLYFQIRGASPTRSGVLIIPFALFTSLTSVLGGASVTKMGDYRPAMWSSFSVMAIGYGLMIMLDESTSRALEFVYTIIAGLGAGCFFLPPLLGLQAAMPVKDMATTTTTFGLVRALGSTIGLSVGQAIWTGVLRARLSKISNLTLDLSGAALADNVRRIQTIEPESVRQQVLHAYTKS
ncbi:major facilitator superfamily-domain-containing protein, partial [Mycena epipterygia]